MPRPPADRGSGSLGRDFFAGDALEVAPQLLNKVLISTVGGVTVSARIVEVEAYRGAEDPASHAFRGPTPRNSVMFGPPGYLYVYFTYGMHWCANVVCSVDGRAQAVLLRAGAPLIGLADLHSRRPKARRDRDLLSGPARLCQGLGIDGSFGGLDVTDPDTPLQITDDGMGVPVVVGTSTRIGVKKGAEHPWRFFVPGDPNLSGPAALNVVGAVTIDDNNVR